MDWAAIHHGWEQGWRPALEILLLAVGIYYVLMFVRGTRGWSVVIGFLLLLVFTFAAWRLHLQIVSWLLEKFFAVWAFAVLVIFQPELRRMLSELGNFRIFSESARSAWTDRPRARHSDTPRNTVSGRSARCDRKSSSFAGLALTSRKTSRAAAISSDSTGGQPCGSDSR
jgi:DNA integrity scanning protein DisA with diadenylate cyclase activity